MLFTPGHLELLSVKKEPYGPHVPSSELRTSLIAQPAFLAESELNSTQIFPKQELPQQQEPNRKSSDCRSV